MPSSMITAMRNLKILAWTHLVTGVLTVLLALFFMGAFVGDEFGGEEAVIGLIIVSLFVLKGASSLVLAWGLLALKPWSRMLGNVLSVLHLPLFPIGTLMGVYGLMVLKDADTSQVLAEASAPRPAVTGWAG